MRRASARAEPLARRACCGLALLAFWVAGATKAAPLDVTDPTPRAIQIEFEISFSPVLVAQSYSVPFVATYSALGNTGTVVIPAAQIELAIENPGLDYFDILVAGSVVPASVPDFVLEIDLTTLEATSQPFSYQVSLALPFPNDVGTVTRELSTTAAAGFAVNPMFPTFPFFCSTLPPCVALVPGAPYDPIAGTLNAVGSDLQESPDTSFASFSRAGDLRLSEVPSVSALSLPALWSLGALILGVRALALRVQCC